MKNVTSSGSSGILNSGVFELIMNIVEAAEFEYVKIDL
jgi:hypothetical protein